MCKGANNLRIFKGELEMKPKWICGLYCRLSVEDSNNRESNSIQSQKIILSNFVEDLPNAVIGKIYVDDGFSGSNFDRPDFKRMIEAVEDGLINCVIVKDYSRFGRDYIDVGYYIEKYFPDKKVRFISVNDNHDSLNGDAQDDLKMPIMNMFNDIQSRETSKKVRSGLKARKQQGKFIGAFAPYGYLKSDEDKNKLIIDDNVAHVVRQIFAWRVEGYSTYAINTKLNEMNVPTPTVYKNSIGLNINPVNAKGNKVALWNETTVRKILANEAYIGNVVQNKSTTKNHRTKKKVNIEESNWIKVEATHDAIIDIETWDKVKSMVKKRTRMSTDGKLNLFAGILRCADCGRTMVKKTNGKGYISFTCTTHMSDKSKCGTHTISENVLKESIFKVIMFQVKLATDVNLLLEEMKNTVVKDNKIVLYNSTVNNIVRDKELKAKILKDIYFDLKKGLISEGQYIEMKRDIENELGEIERQLEKLEKNKPEDLISNELSITQIFDKFESKKELTRDMICELIECIYVNEDRSLRVDFKFADEIESVLNR